MSEKSLSEQLRSQYKDIISLYNKAAEEDNAAQMERLTKLSAALSKQIKDHEEHEQKTLDREFLTRLHVKVGLAVSRALRRYIDEDKAVLIYEMVNDDLLELAKELD